MTKILLSTLCCAILLAVTQSNNGYSDEDLNEYMEYAMADFKLKLHKTIQTRQKRSRREITTDDFTWKNRKIVHMSDIANITPWQSIPTSYPVELEPFVINNDNYMAVVNFKNQDGAYRTESAVYILNGTQFRLLQNFTTSGGIDFEFADLGREQYAIFLDHVGQNWYGGSDKYTYMKSFQVNQFLPGEGQNKPFQYRTKVRALGAKKVKVFTKDNKHYFVTANSYHKMGNLYHVKSTMHVQTAYGYQLVQEFHTQGAQDVEVEVIDGRRFIFFANKMDNAGKVDIYSIIYVEHDINHKGRNPFKLYQRIGTHGARDFEYFTFDGNHYLAVANEYTQVKSMDANTGKPITVNNYNVDSVIYWWTGTMWVQWQLIPTNGAVKWAFFKSTFGDPMLVVANTRAPPVIFTYDPLRGIFVPAQQQNISPIPAQPNIISDVRSVMPFSTDDGVYLAVANYNPIYTKGYNIFKVGFEVREVKQLEPSIPEVITAHLLQMKEELHSLEISLTELLDEVTHQVMTISTEQNITSNVYMGNVTITETLTTENLFYRRHVNKHATPHSPEVAELAKRLEEQEEKIKALEAKYADAVFLNQDTIITGKKVLTDHVSISRNLATNTLNVSGLIDDTKIEQLHDQTLRKSIDQTINGNYIFTKNVSVSNINVTSLNGLNVSRFMTTNTEQTITGLKTFNDTLTIDELNMENFTLNGLRIPQDIVTRDGNHTITGRKEFNSVHTKDLQIDGLLNGVNFTDFIDNRMTLTSDQVVRPVTFGDGFSTTSSINVGGLVDGVNLTSIGKNMSDALEEVKGPKTFHTVIVKGHVTTLNHVNGYDLNKTVTLNTSQVITANMTFESDLNVTGDVLNGTVNGMRFSEQVVTKHGNQSIAGTKTFISPVTLHKNLNTHGKIDGVDIKEWNRSAVRKNTTEPVTGMKQFTGGVNITELYVQNVNGIDLNTLKDNIVWIHNGTKWTSEFHFDTVTVNNLSIDGTLNDYKIPDGFVPLNTDGPIYGVKNFTNITNIAGNISVVGDLSGKNFSEFYESILKNNTDEVINGNVTFLNNMTVYSVNVTGKINNLTVPDDIVTTTTYQNVSAILNFTKDTTFEGSVHAHTIVVNSTVNGIDISVMEENAIHKDKNQTINGTIIFVGGIDCKQNLSVAGLINGINLTELMDMTVRISRAQNVSGIKNFTQNVLLEAPLVTPGTINGVDISDLNRTSLKTEGNQTIHSDIIINGDVNAVTIDTNGSHINAVDFEQFLNNAARSDVHNTIYGNVSYVNKLSVDSLTSGPVDGVNVSEVLLTKNNQTVIGHLNFTSASVGNLSITGPLDGVDLHRLVTKSLKLYGEQNITGKYTLRDVDVNGNVSLTGIVNGINLTEFDSAAVHLTGDEIITGKKHFTNVTVGNVTFDGLVNNANMTLLFDDALLQNGYQEVCQRKTFMNSVSVLSNTTINHIEVHGNVNDINLTNFVETAVRLDGSKVLHGNYTFLSGIEVDGDLNIGGNLNGTLIPNDYMTTFNDQVVTGHKIFENVVFMKNLDITGLIDGVNLTDIYRNRVTLSGDQELQNLHFSSAELDRNMELPNESTINNIDISEDLVPVNKPSVITGSKVFNSTFIRGDLDVKTGMVNGVNVTKLEKDTVKLYSTTKQQISADQKFTQNWYIQGNMTVDGLINGVKIADIQKYSKNISDKIKDELDVLSIKAKYLCNVTTAVLPIAITEHVLTGIEKVDVFKSFPVDGGHLGFVHSTTIGNDIFVSVARPQGSTCGSAYILKCNQVMECVIHQTIITNAPKMEFFNYATFDAVIVWNWNSGTNDSFICKTEPEIYVFNQTVGRYLPYQTLDAALFDSDLAPFITSISILAPYLGEDYSKYQKTSAVTSQAQRMLPLDIKWFERDGKNYLVVGGYDQQMNFVDIFSFDGKNLASLRVDQRIKTNGGHVSVGRMNNNQPIIATASDGQRGSIQLYIFNEVKQKFEFYQRLDPSASTVAMETMNDKQYLLHASPTHGFGLCEWLGVSGYGACIKLEATETTSVETIITSSGAYVVAGTDESLMIYRTLFKGNSKAYDKPVC